MPKNGEKVKKETSIIGARSIKKVLKSKKIDKKKIVMSGFLLFIVAILLVQIFYSKDLVRPFIKFEGKNIGFTNRVDFENSIHKIFNDSVVKLKFDGVEKDYKYADLGFEISLDGSQKDIFDYDLWKRFLPFSIFEVRDFSGIKLSVKREKLKIFAEKFVKENSKSAERAILRIDENGEVILKDAEKGREFNVDELIDFFEKNVANLAIKSFDIPYRKTNIEDKNNYIAVKNKLNKFLEQGLILSYEGKDFKIERREFSDFINIEVLENEIKLLPKQEKINQKIAELNKKVEQPAKQVKVIFEDGVEIRREGGKRGRRISISDFSNKMSQYLAGDNFSGKINISPEEVPSTEQKIYTFSRTSKGLRAKIESIARKYRNVKISVKQLDSDGWQASYRGGEPTVSASTYKLFVAMRVFEWMRQDNHNWGSGAHHNMSIDACFNEMIVVSTNRCSEAWLAQFGRAEMNEYIYRNGISGATNFNTGNATTTSADDLVRILEKIHYGSWVSGEQQEYLLGLLARQKHRKGIPSASKGQVFDKVGFLWDYTNDAAIVKHPRGTYIVAIMTKGSGGYPTIAQITRELEEFMYP